jgi:LacI family transcriptional regulator
MANLRDVAKKAGVSTATVSRALSDAARVRPRTRARVLRAAQELRYRPNRQARELRGGRSRTVGLVVSNLENPFFLDKFHYLEEEALRRGYEVVVESTGYDPHRLRESLEGMLARSLAGLVVSASELDASASEILDGVEIPVVVFMADLGVSLPACTRINVDDATGVQTMVSYLLSLGHHRFGVLGHHTKIGNLKTRSALIERALRASGSGVRIASAEVGDSPAGGRLGSRVLLAGRPRPTAIICLNDHVAIGVLRGIREHGLAVPGDVSVVGFDNIGLSEYTNPSLTTVHVPRDDLGRLAMERILDVGRAAPNEVILDPQLLIRESTGPAPAVRQNAPE